MKVLLDSFHLSGDTLGFHPHIPKLQIYIAQALTLGGKG